MTCKSLYLVLSVLFIFSNGKAQQAFMPMKDTAMFKTKIAEKSKLTNTIESDFVQEKNLSVLSEKIITKGHFCFKKESQLRWEYLIPFEYVIVINKDKVMIKDEDKISHYDMNSNKMFKSINEMMINSVQGNVLNNKDYIVRYMENAQHFLVEMTPVQKGTRGFLQAINLYFSKDDYMVSKVKLIEPTGDYTSIDFVNQKKNESISDSKFTLH